MPRTLLVLAGAVIFGSALAGCSSGSNSNDATKTVVGKTRTAAAATQPPATASAVARATSSAAGSTPGAAGTVSGAGGSPASGTAPAGSTAGAETPGSTPAPGETVPANAPATAGAPGATATPGQTSSGGDGFSLSYPSSPTGSFDVTITLSGRSNFRGFSVKLTFDASLVRATSIDDGTVISTTDGFCVPPALQDGSAAFACTILGSGTTSNAGAVAIVHFQALKAGAVHLHFVTYAEDNSEGTYLVGGSDPTSPQAVTAPTHDADITVGP